MLEALRLRNGIMVKEEYAAKGVKLWLKPATNREVVSLEKMKEVLEKKAERIEDSVRQVRIRIQFRGQEVAEHG